jgi:uncharacterized membrane protein
MAKHNPSNQLPLPSPGSEIAKEVEIFMAQYSGPLPPPNILKDYNEVVSNGAERIMVMAEEQSKHRRALETKALHTDSRNSLLGVIFAFLLGITTVVTGAIVAIKGQTFSGAFISSVGLGGLVSTFIYGTKQRREEREGKAKTS